MPEKKVVNRIRALRHKRGWSADELSARTGRVVPTSTIQKIEHNHWTPNVTTAMILADALRVSLSKLYYWEEQTE